MNIYNEENLQFNEELILLDSILTEYREVLGKDYTAYRNHCIRVVLFFQAMKEPSSREKGKLATAAAFHDLGIWTHKTFDYLKPSVDQAMDYLKGKGLSAWSEEIKETIEQHHKVTAIRRVRVKRESDPFRNTESGHSIAETFRRADWIDVSLGILRFGIPRSHIREIRSVYPNAGFHRRLLLLTLQQIRKEPWNPLPMFRL